MFLLYNVGYTKVAQTAQWSTLVNVGLLLPEFSPLYYTRERCLNKMYYLAIFILAHSLYSKRLQSLAESTIQSFLQKCT